MQSAIQHMKSLPGIRFFLWPKRLQEQPWILLAVAAYVFFAPNVDFVRDLQWHDGQRLAQLVLLAVVVLVLAIPDQARSLADTWGLLSRWTRMALAGAFVLGLASSLLAPLPRWALLEWGLLLLLLVLVLCIAAQRRQLGESVDRLLVLLLFATAAAYTVSVCAVYVGMLLTGSAYGQIFDIRELYVSFSNVRFSGHVQTMLLPFLLLPAMWWGSTPVRRVLLWSVPALWWMLVIGSGTRGTWVALLVGVVAVWMFGGGRSRQWIKWMTGGLLCGLLCYAVFIVLVPMLLEQPTVFTYRPNDFISLSRREVLWAAAAGYAAQHPLLGIGPIHYAYFATEVAAHPHNAVLQWLAEWGLPAALLFTAVSAVAGLTFAGWVKRTADTAGKGQGLVRVALLAALTGAAAQAMVDGVLVMPVSQTLLVLLCGWAAGMYFADRFEQHCGTVERAVLMAVTLLAAAVVAYGVAPEIGQVVEREKAYLKASPPNTLLLPRFWTQGWISR